MRTNRLIINTYDQSSTAVEATSSIVGATMVDAPRGPNTPILINNLTDLKNIFGVSSKAYPELFEAETFIGGYSCYVANSEIESATVPCVLAIKDGYYQTRMNYTKEVEDFIANKADTIPSLYDVDEDGNGIVLVDLKKETDGTISLPALKEVSTLDDANIATEGIYDEEDPDKLIQGGKGFIYQPDGIFDMDQNEAATEHDPSVFAIWVGIKDGATDPSMIGKAVHIFYKGTDYTGKLHAVPEVQENSTGVPEGYLLIACGTDEDYKASADSKWFDEEFPSDLAESAGVYFDSQLTISDEEGSIDRIHAVIFPKYASNDIDFYVSIKSAAKSALENSINADRRNILSISASCTTSQGLTIKTSDVVGSLNETDVSATGALLGFVRNPATYAEQDVFAIYVPDDGAFTVDDLADSAVKSDVYFSGSCGESTCKRSGKNWEVFEDLEDIDLFFDPAKRLYTEELDDSFKKLYKSFKLSGFIFNATVPAANVKPSLPALNLTDASTRGANFWNVCQTGKVAKTDGSTLMTSFTGAKALLQANILVSDMGGVAPMFTTGIVPLTNIVSLSQRYKPDAQDILDACNYNPIVYDKTFGYLFTAHKTCKGGAITDWSYIGHVSAFLNFQKEVRNSVMVPQIGKPNNPYYRELRKSQTESILGRRLTANRIWAAGVVDTSTAEGINDTAALLARKFVIQVKIKVDIFSEWVVLNVYNVDQTVDIE